MAGPAPKTKMWTARENKQGDVLVLVVGGQVEVTCTYRVPKLAEGGPLRDPHTLNLDLTIVDSGQTGTDVVVWMPASFQQDVKSDQYHDVVVRWDGEKIAQFAVIDDSEHSVLLDKHSKAQKTVAKAATKPKAPTAKKVAEKVAEPAAKPVAKKASKKASKKTSKKAAKKAPPAAAKKKAAKSAKKGGAKKTAKKAAKKSTLKGLVKKLVKKFTPAKKKAKKKR
jgi:hypothetical protein